MKLVFHGGKCCGIKTIHSLCNNPEAMLSPLSAKAVDNSDAYGHNVSSDKDFFHEGAPEETYLARLDRYLEYCDRRRPHGIIEITLAKCRYENPTQPEAWDALLFARGFKVVNSCQNSNSGNRVFIYHRNSDVPGMEGMSAEMATCTEIIDDEADDEDEDEIW